ncbi:MAG: hypothetical protein ACK5PF_00620, partial [bacterium]
VQQDATVRLEWSSADAMKTDQAPNATPEAVCSTAMLGAWQPIETAPRDGTSFRVPPDAGYTHAFWQDGFWWWHSVHSGRDGDYAVGPEPKAWMPAPPLPKQRGKHERGSNETGAGCAGDRLQIRE